jgi:hypothetical protein
VSYTKENLAAALAAARAGFRVFPATIYYDGEQETWIKKPLIADWQEHATTNEKTLRAWFNQRPDMIPAIVHDRTALLDADRHDPEVDGVENFAQMCCDIGPLPRHPMVHTPGDGCHHFFKQPTDEPIGNSPGGLSPGVDVRGVGGWSPAVGSVRSDGGRYELIRGSPSPNDMLRDGTLPELTPEWLTKIRNGYPATSTGSARATIADSTEEPVDVNAELAEMRPGNVNATQCRVIGSLLSQGAGYDEIIGSVVAATMEMAANHYRCRGWTKEREYTFVHKALAAILKARCRAHENTGAAPVWVEEPLAELFEAMYNAGQRPCIVWRKDSGWHLRDMAWAWGAGTESEQSSLADERAPGAGKDEVTEPGWPTPYSARPASAIPPRQWLYGKHYIRGAVTLTAAPGGTGKSQHSLVEAVSMATGRDLVGGEHLPERLRAWVWNAEDDIAEMERRVCGICDHYALDREDLREWLFLDSSDTLPLELAHGNGRGVMVRETTIATIAARVANRRLDVVILDPLVALHTLPEADNTAQAKVLRILRQRICVPCNCGVEIIAHTRKLSKDADRDMAADDVRGAGSIVYSVRSTRLLHPMTLTDAEKYGIEGDARHRYFRVERVKTNMARRETMYWVEMVERPIANGENGSYKDTVVVSTLWTPQSVTDKVTPAVAAAICSEIGKAEYRRDQRAGNWAGKLIAQRLGLDVSNPSHKRQVKDLLNWLIGRGTLASELRNDRSGHSREYIVPGSNT